MDQPEIGFDRTLRRDWMDRVASLVGSGATEPSIRKEMRSYLEPDVPGTDARRKVITVLLRVWISPQGHVRVLRDEALRLWSILSSRDRVVLHWGLCSAAYPFFREFALQVGRLGRLQEHFTGAQVHRRMRERFGDRELVHRAGRHVLYTFVDWGVIAPVDGRGVYHLRSSLPIDTPALASWLVEAELAATSARAVRVYTVAHSGALFPFDLPSVSDIRAEMNPRLEFSRRGVSEDVVALACR